MGTNHYYLRLQSSQPYCCYKFGALSIPGGPTARLSTIWKNELANILRSIELIGKWSADSRPSIASTPRRAASHRAWPRCWSVWSRHGQQTPWNHFSSTRFCCLTNRATWRPAPPPAKVGTLGNVTIPSPSQGDACQLGCVCRLTIRVTWSIVDVSRNRNGWWNDIVSRSWLGLTRLKYWFRLAMS